MTRPLRSQRLCVKLSSVRDDLTKAIKEQQAAFDLGLDESVLDRLGRFHDLVVEHNPVLHLVGPCSAEEFAIRHILESLTLLKHLPVGAKFADVGTGAGLPSIPCLLVRDELRATLIESKEKKAKFLEMATEQLGLANRVSIINRQFEEAETPDAQFVTCRALDRFTDKLPRLVKWSRQRTLLLFGGENLRDALKRHRLSFAEQLMPLSEKRFLFVVTR